MKFDCKEHLMEQQNTYHSVELLLKQSLTFDLPAPAWLGKMKLSEWEGSFKAMLKKKTTTNKTLQGLLLGVFITDSTEEGLHLFTCHSVWTLLQ